MVTKIGSLITLGSVGQVLLDKLAGEGVDVGSFLESLAEEVGEVEGIIGSELVESINKNAREISNKEMQKLAEGIVDELEDTGNLGDLTPKERRKMSNAIKGILIGGGIGAGLNIAAYPSLRRILENSELVKSLIKEAPKDLTRLEKDIPFGKYIGKHVGVPAAIYGALGGGAGKIIDVIKNKYEKEASEVDDNPIYRESGGVSGATKGALIGAGASVVLDALTYPKYKKDKLKKVDNVIPLGTPKVKRGILGKFLATKTVPRAAVTAAVGAGLGSILDRIAEETGGDIKGNYMKGASDLDGEMQKLAEDVIDEEMQKLAEGIVEELEDTGNLGDLTPKERKEMSYAVQGALLGGRMGSGAGLLTTLSTMPLITHHNKLSKPQILASILSGAGLAGLAGAGIGAGTGAYLDSLISAHKNKYGKEASNVDEEMQKLAEGIVEELEDTGNIGDLTPKERRKMSSAVKGALIGAGLGLPVGLSTIPVELESAKKFGSSRAKALAAGIAGALAMAGFGGVLGTGIGSHYDFMDKRLPGKQASEINEGMQKLAEGIVEELEDTGNLGDLTPKERKEMSRAVKGALIGAGGSVGLSALWYPLVRAYANSPAAMGITDTLIPGMSAEVKRHAAPKNYLKKMIFPAAIWAGIGGGIGKLMDINKREKDARKYYYDESFNQKYADFLDDPELLKEAAEDVIEEAEKQQQLAYEILNSDIDTFNKFANEEYDSEIVAQAMLELIEESEQEKQGAMEILAGISSILAAGKNLATKGLGAAVTGGKELAGATKTLGKGLKSGYDSLTPLQKALVTVPAVGAVGAAGAVAGGKLAKRKSRDNPPLHMNLNMPRELR